MKTDQNMKNKEFYVTPETEVIEINYFESTLTDYTAGDDSLEGVEYDNNQSIGW